MIRSVPLQRLPIELRFPAELASKISFDPTRQRLQFDGFMSKTDFDKLVRLHNDLAYQRALLELFQICTFVSSAATKPAPRRAPIVFAGLAAAAVLTLTVILLLRH